MNNSCDLLITDASVVVPKVGVIETSIMVEDGRVKALTNSAGNISASRKINANGKYVLPGAIDPHVHYGVYTPIDEAARTESRSAAVGGITTMVRMLRLYDNSQHNKAATGKRGQPLHRLFHPRIDTPAGSGKGHPLPQGSGCQLAKNIHEPR